MGFNRAKGFNSRKSTPTPAIQIPVEYPAPPAIHITGEDGAFILNEDGSGSRLVSE